MSQTHERRQFWRAAFHAPAALVLDSAPSTVEVLDLSLKGALLELPAGLEPAVGQCCELQLSLAADVRISMHASIAHLAGRRAGLRCAEIDLDSVTHLRRLVELNSGDPGQLERELALLGR